jgi:thioredoxin reductase
MARRLIVIGAGPIGLEAALGAIERGFDVTVLEKDAPGASLMKWGATKFFSPLGMNVGARSKKYLGAAAPAEDALLTGPEHAEKVLRPMIENSPLRDRVKSGRRVISVGRARMTRMDYPAHPLRGERPFRLLVERTGNPTSEEVYEADVVLDASGVCETPAYAGGGGAPAIGERGVARMLIRQLGPLYARLPELAGRRILLIGHGHSAANSIEFLAQSGAASVMWAVRSPNARPCVEIANDPLAQRREIVRRANALAEAPPSWLSVERRAHVESFVETSAGLEVRLSGGRGGTFDAVAAFTGYRPDLSFLSELALEISPISEGAHGIQRALANITDCLNVPQLSPKDLMSGEPGFYLLGIKSYGRMPTFLLQTGFSQLETILAQLKG